jgi:trans-2,3-dihydro-3-hydroxyanthranilate isomerase
MATYRYRIVDVFTEHPLEGNPLAVFLAAEGLDDSTMQKIAKEMNLSETTFLLPPARDDCAIRVRIFTPTFELRFAGHPTIGSAFVALNEGMVAEQDRFCLEEKVGPVPVRVERGERTMLWLTTPRIEHGSTYEPSLLARVLGLEREDVLHLPPQMVSAGNPTVFVALKDKDAVDRATFDMSGVRMVKSAGDESFCVFVFTPTPEGAYSRMFAPEYGVAEDPATGSATGPLAVYMMKAGLVSSGDGTRFVSEQGTKIGRRSFLHVLIHGERGVDGIEVGGCVTPLVEAEMTL